MGLLCLVGWVRIRRCNIIKMETGKLFAFLLLGIFMISMASAELISWDNWGKYNEATREFVVRDLTGEIGKARLNTPLIVLIKELGYQKVAEFELWAYEDYNDVLKNIDFYDKTKEDWESHKLQKEFDIKYKTYEDIAVNDYQRRCSIDKHSLNKTEICDDVIIGVHTEKRIVWKNITSARLDKNEQVTIGIFTNVEDGDYVEWIPTIYGVKNPNWAVYLEEDITSEGATICSGSNCGNSANVFDNDYDTVIGGLSHTGDYVGKDFGTSRPINTTRQKIFSYTGGTVILEGYDGSWNEIWSRNHDEPAITFNTTVDTYYSQVRMRCTGSQPCDVFEFRIYGDVLQWSDQSPNMILNNPVADANYTSPQTISFNFTVWDDVELSDVKIYVNTVLNQTNATGINNSDYLFDLNLGDGDYVIYGEATDNESATNTSQEIRIVVDSSYPALTSALNLTDQTTWNLPINSTWNYTATDPSIDQCYYNTSDNATQIIHTCNSSIITTWATGGNKTVQYCANDTFGFETCNTDYLYVYYVQETQGESQDPTVEGLTVTWNLTVNLTDTPTQTAYLVINNTVYTPTATAGVNGYFFELVKQIPDNWGNTSGNILDWYWNYSITGVTTNKSTDLENITVYELSIDDCSAYSEVILNMSLLDEETATSVNESAGANIEIDLTIQSKANLSIILQYSKAWANENNPQVCIPANVLNNSQYWVDFTVGFSSTDRVWEFFYVDSGTFNSTKTFEFFNGQLSSNISLMDLKTADSTSFLFNYFDQDGLAVDDAIVHVMRKYIGDGQFLEVERSKADENGDTIVHLVEEDVIYFFYITQFGQLLYTSSTYTALCQTTPCTIQIEASGDGATFPTDWDLVDGGAYDVSSDASAREVTLSYSFNESDTINLTVYKYNSDGSYSSIGTNSTTGTAGEITLGVPQVAGNVSFFASVTKGEDFKNSEWVDFEQKSRDYIGITLGLLLSALIILSLGLMTISEGAGTIFYIILGVFVSGALGLMRTELSTGVSVVIYLILAGGMLLWKFTRRRS